MRINSTTIIPQHSLSSPRISRIICSSLRIGCSYHQIAFTCIRPTLSQSCFRLITSPSASRSIQSSVLESRRGQLYKANGTNYSNCTSKIPLWRPIIFPGMSATTETQPADCTIYVFPKISHDADRYTFELGRTSSRISKAVEG